MNTFIIIILFYLFYALISFVIVYANDTADIANDDFENTCEPSLIDLSEEDRTSYCIVDDYIKNTICPRYHHKILKNEINNYQKTESFYPSFFFINLYCSVALLKTLGVEKWFVLFLVITIIIGYACYFVVWLLYRCKKHSTIRIKSYHEIHSSYDWESHYAYLCSIKKNVIFRHMLRNTVCILAVLGLIVTICLNAN